MRKIHEKIRYTILTLIDLLYPLFKRLMPLQTFRYAACGGINTFLDIALFSVGYNIVFKKQAVVLGSLTISPHIAALFMALSISLPTGFYLNRYVVFQESGLNRRSQLLRYLLVVAICIVLNYVFLKLFVDYLHWYPTLAKITTTALIVIFSYTSQTFYFFKARPKTN
jgi:putative flippase GtrA